MEQQQQQLKQVILIGCGENCSSGSIPHYHGVIVHKHMMGK